MTSALAYDLADRLISATVGGVGETYAYGLSRIAVSTPAGGPAYEYHDGLGSLSDLVSSSAPRSAGPEYAPFGAVRTQAAPSAGPLDPFGFTGEYLDPTGLYQLRAREYDPATGRFLSTDPVSPALSDPYVGAYVYVGNNPCRFVDPSGRESQPPRGSCPPAIAAAALGLVFLGPIDALLGLANILALPSVIAELALLPADVAAIYATGYLYSILQQAQSTPCENIRLASATQPIWRIAHRLWVRSSSSSCLW